MMLTIPSAEHPRASLIVVTWNAVEWSQRAIESIVVHTDPPYELIIVDNASTDGTRDFLHREVSGATIVLNDQNFGFGIAANLGAARARAPVLVFVNSDLLVRPGWLEPLCGRLENDPDACVAGPKILDLDGRVDHAGALMGHDGSTMHYGSGDDPARAEYVFARRVDYVSGACMAIRARAFHDAGGFDAWFEIAYFEDADLCLRLAIAGWDIWYEPESIVTHAGGASGTEEGRLRLLAINHPRFQQRWRDVLAMRPDAPLTQRPERILAARDAIATGTILLIGTGSGVARHIAQSLSRMASLRITLAGEPLSGVENVDGLSREWLEIRRFHYDVIAGSGAALEPFLSATQPQAVRLALDEFLENVDATLAAAGIAPHLPRSRYNALPWRVTRPDALSMFNDEMTRQPVWRTSRTLGGPDLDLPERAFPGMPNAALMGEHCMRYALALHHVQRMRVLDLGCGTGYGSEMLTWVAESVHGFDLWEPQPHERPEWPGGAILTFGHDLCVKPLPAADAAVMFEVIEHLDDAPAALRNAFAAAPLLITSFPNPKYHGSHINKYHVNDWQLEQFEHELHEAAKQRRSSSVTLTHLQQLAGGPLIVPGRDPEASYWIVIAQAHG